MRVAPDAAAAPPARLRPQILAVTPPTGVVSVPAVAPAVVAEARREDLSEGSPRAASSWAPLFGHPGFALWLRTPGAVEHVELPDLSPKERVLAPWSAARYRLVLDVAARHEIRVFIGTCAPDLQAALEHADHAVVDALGDRRLAGFIVRGDPDEVTLHRLRMQLDSLDAVQLALGRSMHGLPRGSTPLDSTAAGAPAASLESLSDFTVIAPFRAAITQKPDTSGASAGAVAAKPLGETGLAAWTTAKSHVIAMGGINVRAAQDAASLGASGIAGIDAFFGEAAAVAENARAFAALFPPPPPPPQ